MVSSLKLAAAFAVAAVLVSPSLAHADDVDRCVAASEKGQKDRRAGHLNDARSAFLVCADGRCPAVVRTACAEWLEQVNAALPTIVVAVTDAEKRDVVEAHVSVDGKEVALGRAVTLDPGPHTVSVDAAGFEPHSQQIVARETERGRTISAVLTRKIAPPPPPRAAEERSIRPITLITGGAAVLALGSFAVFGLTGRSQADDLRTSCAPACSDADRSAVKTRYIVADISLIAAVILGGVSVWTLMAADSK